MLQGHASQGEGSTSYKDGAANPPRPPGLAGLSLLAESPVMLVGVGLWRKITVRTMWDCSGGPVVKNLTCKAGDRGSVSGWGTKIPHAAKKLSPRATATELTCSGTSLPQLEG